MYDLVQTSESARQWTEFTRKEFPGDFTASLDLTAIYDGRAVFEPNPSQQGLKPPISATYAITSLDVFEPNPSQQGLKQFYELMDSMLAKVFEPNPSQQGLKQLDLPRRTGIVARSLNPIHHNKD